MSDKIPFTISDIASAIADGRTTAVAVAEDILERCRDFSHLGAIITQDAESLIAAARASDQYKLSNPNHTLRPLHGVPLLIKDNIDTCDLPTSVGTPALENDQPLLNAPVVQRLVDAGALIAGKANLYELAVGGTSFNEHFGGVKNPWNIKCIPGGSSSGSAAAVAARMLPGALGTDTNGSVRGPCSFSGISGLRPSFQRYPFGGVMPSSPTRDAVGIMANSIADLALLDQVLSNQYSGQLAEILQPSSIRGIRLGLPKGEFYRLMDDEVIKVINDLVAKMLDAGAIIVEVDVPEIVTLTAKTAWTISAYETPLELPGYLKNRGTDRSIEDIVDQIASTTVRERFNPNAVDLKALEPKYRQAMDEYRPQLQKILHEYFIEQDVIAMIYPTTPFPAPELPNNTADDFSDVYVNGERIKGGFSAVINNTVHQSAAGIPSLVIPAGLTKDGLPVGLSIDGPIGSDRKLLAIGQQLEIIRGAFPLPANSAKRNLVL
ncbi:MAG: amidase family protein [Pseudomonadota bacterium]|nr:amidase family protein [Pseudomonadota bacterium]